MLAGFDPAVAELAAQPFQITGPVQLLDDVRAPWMSQASV
jgi:hypothetical protein